MSDAGLLRTTDAIALLIREGEALLARLAGEVARRSPRESGKDGLAKKQGYANPARLVAASTGGALADVARLINVGAATAERHTLSGDRLPAKHPHVAAGLQSGIVSVEAAAAITGMLDRVALRADPQHAARVEKLLTAQAADLPLELLHRVIRAAEARLDPDGVQPREEELRADRSVAIWEDSRSMVHINSVMDPESGAPVKAAIEVIVTHWIRAAKRDGGEHVCDGASAGPVVADDRTIPQMQADALAMIARHVLGCSGMPQAPAMALVVRTDLDTLVDGVGHATIDGLSQPVSASTVRKLAAATGIIPAVLGTDSIPLDLGRTNRLFTRAQRIALGERDGGCACCGLPLSYVEAHHVQWWKRDTGPTNLDNGVLLCPPCHTRIHEDEWVIRVRDSQIWFIPPPHVDPTQTPRLGGNARFGAPSRHDTNVA